MLRLNDSHYDVQLYIYAVLHNCAMVQRVIYSLLHFQISYILKIEARSKHWYHVIESLLSLSVIFFR